MLTDSEILNIVSVELQQSAGGNENDFVDSNRQNALAYYLGQPNGKEVEGRSSVISTDVADAIEWIMPEIVKAFTQNNEVVTFDPRQSGDEDQAELESQYVYDILMKDNEGFVVIHQLIKDALMQKNGIVKTFYKKETSRQVEHYTGLTEPELQIVASDPDIEIMEVKNYIDNDSQLPLFDVKANRSKNDSKCEVLSIPPEEFRVNRQHNSISLTDARFTAHVYLVTAGDLVEEGFDKEFVDSIPSSQVYEDDREYRFYMQGETVYPDRDNIADPSLRTIEVAECFMRMDIDEDGIPEYIKIRVTGGDNPDKILDIEEVDSNPFISGTTILMSHKFFGLSIYDRLKEIQDQKTTLWRNILDNMYLQNNQRTIVVENQVNLDDLLISRPGGIIRAKRADAVQPYVTPPLSADAYKMMDYLDQVRAGRSGVSPEGTVQDSNIGDRVGSEGLERMMNQKEELVGLMVRVIAETAIKPLCYKIREEVTKHQDIIRQYMFRGQWMEVDPRLWGVRTHTTVRVGTGSGNRKQQSAAISQISMIQEKLLVNPNQTLVKEEQIYNAVNDFAKFNGLAGAGQYLVDPRSPQGKQFKQEVAQKNQMAQQQQEKEKQMMAEFQAKIADAETSKAATAQENVRLKGQIDYMKNEIAAADSQSDTQIDLLKQRLAEAETLLKAEGQDEELKFKYWQARQNFELEYKRIESVNNSND